MPVKWILFRLANYLLAIFFLLKLIALVTVASTVKRSDIASFVPFVLNNIVVIVNCALNLYILSHYFPDKPLTGRMKKIYVASIIILPICFIAEAFYFWSGMQDKPTRENQEAYSVLLWTWFFFILLELFVLVGQFIMRKTLRTNSDQKQRELIEQIGS